MVIGSPLWVGGCGRTPLRTTATDSVGPRMPCAASASRPATPAVPVSSASIPVAPQASGWPRAGPARRRRPPGRRSRASPARPRASRRSRRRGSRGRRSRARSPTATCSATDGSPRGGDRRGRARVGRHAGDEAQVRHHPLERTGERRATARLDGVEGRDGLDRADRRRIVETRGRSPMRAPRRPPGRRSGPACTPPRAARRLISQASVAPPSIARPLSGPWQVNGIAPPARASCSRRYEGSPASPGRARAGDDDARRGSRRRSTTTASAVVGDEHPQLAAGRPGDHGGGAGRRCRSSRWRAGVAGSPSPSASATRSSSRIPNRWRALCEPATLPVSSLTQTVPSAPSPRRGRSPAPATSGRDPEAVRRPRRPRRRRARGPGPRTGRPPSPPRGRRGRRGTARGSGRTGSGPGRPAGERGAGRCRGPSRGRCRRPGRRFGQRGVNGRCAGASAPQPAQTSPVSTAGGGRRPAGVRPGAQPAPRHAGVTPAVPRPAR